MSTICLFHSLAGQFSLIFLQLPSRTFVLLKWNPSRFREEAYYVQSIDHPKLP
jgi:hypothetical protein